MGLCVGLRSLTGMVVVVLTLLFRINAFSQSPSISSLVPSSGTVGTAVTIQGTGFSSTVAGNVVHFGVGLAQVQSASDSVLVVLAPAGSTYGPVTVTANGLTGTFLRPFALTYPTNNLLSSSSFAPAFNYSSISDGPYRVVVGDVNGDAKNDIVIANYRGGTFAVLRNITTGDTLTDFSFSEDFDVSTPTSPVSLALGEFNGDGLLDVAIGAQLASQIAIYPNQSSLLGISFGLPVTTNLSYGFKSLASGDFDGDGKVDLAVANRETGTITILRNTSTPGSMSFSQVSQWTTGANPVALTAGDFDGDGRIDLAAAMGATNSALVYRNSTAGGGISFAAGVSFPLGTQPSALTSADLDNDGKVDLISTAQGAATVGLLRNVSSPGVVSFAARVDVATISDPSNLTIGDLTGDGLPDAAVVSTSQSIVSLHKNQSTPGSIQLGPGVMFPVPSVSIGVAIGDVTQNGKAEVVVGGLNSRSVSVFRNTLLPPPLLVVSSDSLVFQPTAGGDSSISTLIIKDSSVAPLRIDSIVVTSSVFSSSGLSLPAVLPGNDSTVLSITFRPAQFGTVKGYLRIYSDGGTAVISLVGPSPSPAITVTPQSVNFGSLPQFDTAQVTLKITNVSVNPLVIDSMWTRTAQFTLLPSSGVVRNTDTFLVVVRFVPTVIASITDSIRIVNNSLAPVLFVPLQGAGVEATLLRLHSGWNLLSIPRNPLNNNPNALFPTKQSPLYTFNTSTQSYETQATLVVGVGFWVYSGKDTVALVAGSQLDTYTTTMTNAGWTILGSIAHQVSEPSIVVHPGDAKTSPLYGYDGPAQAYSTSASVVPGYGYWVYFSKASTTTLQ
jgi:hypothetical protein